MLILGIGGIAYRAYVGKPILEYWQVAVPVFGLLCIIAGWQYARTKELAWTLIWTQVLHWAAFMGAIYALSLPDVRGVIDDNAVALCQLTLLAVGTFVAGVHAQALRLCIVGIVLALAVPAVAWVTESATLIVLCVAALIVVLAAFWLVQRRVARRLAAQGI